SERVAASVALTRGDVVLRAAAHTFFEAKAKLTLRTPARVIDVERGAATTVVFGDVPKRVDTAPERIVESTLETGHRNRFAVARWFTLTHLWIKQVEAVARIVDDQAV